jgi:hypothetical protein
MKCLRGHRLDGRVGRGAKDALGSSTSPPIADQAMRVEQFLLDQIPVEPTKLVVLLDLCQYSLDLALCVTAAVFARPSGCSFSPSGSAPRTRSPPPQTSPAGPATWPVHTPALAVLAHPAVEGLGIDPHARASRDTDTSRRPHAPTSLVFTASSCTPCQSRFRATTSGPGQPFHTL